MPTLADSARVSISDAAYWTRCRICGVLVASTPDSADVCWSCVVDLPCAPGLSTADLAAPVASAVIRRSR